MAVDAAGDVFVGDNTDVLKEIVATNGVVSSSSTVVAAGTTLSPPSGLALDGAGDIFVAEWKANVVVEIQPNAGKFAPAAVATTTPAYMTLDFTFTAAGTIGAPVVLTQGAPGKDFTDAGTGSCTTNGTAYTYKRRGHVYGRCELHAEVGGIAIWRGGAADQLRSHDRDRLRAGNRDWVHRLRAFRLGPRALRCPSRIWFPMPLQPIARAIYTSRRRGQLERTVL